ncbi:MAG: hypothetical protein IPJ42_21760 [Betaproteobacteria bacterium]|nr:hypothetical protein [Betaproteobacteria bacterium]
MATLGVRSGRVEFRSDDRYIVGGNSTLRVRDYRFNSAVAALQWRATTMTGPPQRRSRLESPTLNGKLAYRPGSAG